MKNPFALVAMLVAVAFATPGCAAISAVTNQIPSVAAACQNSVTIKRTWATTLDLYLRVTNVYTAGVQAKTIPRASVAYVEPQRLKAVSVREIGSEAYTACNAKKLGVQIAALSVIIDKVRPFIPGAPAQ